MAGDTTVEGNERFNVNLTTATGGTLSSTARSSFGYINNDDVAPSVISTTAANSVRNDAGNDTLSGGTDNDTLTGGVGADMFRFVTPTGKGVDTITDFQSGTDRIQVISPNFANIPVGTLATNRFVAAGSSLANSNAVFIYNSTTGGLAFDRDGNGTAAAVQIATLTGHPTLRASDFQVVAA